MQSAKTIDVMVPNLDLLGILLIFFISSEKERQKKFILKKKTSQARSTVILGDMLLRSQNENEKYNTCPSNDTLL